MIIWGYRTTVDRDKDALGILILFMVVLACLAAALQQAATQETSIECAHSNPAGRVVCVPFGGTTR